MTPGLQRLLFGFVAALAAADALWIRAGHFEVDIPAYGMIALITLACLAAGLYYDRLRNEPRLSAMLLGTGFLVGMSAAVALLNYLLLTMAGHRIDPLLAGMDRALGIDWPAMMAFAAQHPLLSQILALAYMSLLPQTALLVPLLGWFGRYEEIAPFCLSVAVAALIAVAVWTIAPSFGAFSVYSLPLSTTAHLPLALDASYARALAGLLAHGPGYISPHNIKGLIGFPSFHATLALLLLWYGRELPYLRWPLLALNLTVLAATPIQGGHHVVDVAGGIALTVLAVAIADRIVRRTGRAQARVFAGVKVAAS